MLTRSEVVVQAFVEAVREVLLRLIWRLRLPRGRTSGSPTASACTADLKNAVPAPRNSSHNDQRPFPCALDSFERRSQT